MPLLYPPMSKDQLRLFNGRSIKFEISGVAFLGAVHYTAWSGSFRIIYPVIEEGKTRNQDFRLNSALIERITFDEEQNLLTLQ
jgi:hypothetical protein